LIARNEHGQATVELALCLPIVAVLLAALVNVGLLVANQARVWHAAREAARAAVVDPDIDVVRAAAARGGLAGLEVDVSPEPAFRVQGRPLTVTVAYAPGSGAPVVGAWLDDVKLTARAVMRIEQP
jgi:Flp pilus assembly protein TadG